MATCPLLRHPPQTRLSHEFPTAERDVTAASKRRLGQFSLRTVLIVMTLLCVGPGSYVAYQQDQARKQRAAVAAIERLGGMVDYDSSIPVRSPLMRQILGDDS